MLTSVAQLCGQYGSAIFLVVLFLCSFGLPLAKSWVIVTAGILAGHGDGQALSLWLCCSVGLHAGDFGMFLIGRSLGCEALSRRPFNRLFRTCHVETATRFVERHGMSALLVARILPFVRGPCYFLLGSLKMNLVHFNLLNLGTSLVYCLVFFLIGYHVGNHTEVLMQWIHSGNTLMLILLGVAALGFAWIRFRSSLMRQLVPEPLDSDS